MLRYLKILRFSEILRFSKILNYTLDRLISEKSIFGGKVIQYNFLGSIITFSGDSESAEKTPYNFFCQKVILYNFLWSNITFDEIITFFVEKL